MRDIARIDELLELIREVWKQDPDFRFNQLLYNLQRDYSQKNGGVGQVKKTEDDGFELIGFDFFNLEDSRFIEYLNSIK